MRRLCWIFLGWVGFASLATLELWGCGDADRPDADVVDTWQDEDTTEVDVEVDADVDVEVEDTAGPDGDLGRDSDTAGLPSLDPDRGACEQLERFPESVASDTLPILVHFRPGEAVKAREVLGHLEAAWAFLIGEGGMGFKAPISDEGLCGPDGRFDAFLWRGAESTYVDVIAENERTAIDDWSTHMVVDAWGEFAGDMLDATVAHELNHTSQAAYDWSESSAVFEMTSTFIEDLVYDDDNNYMFLLDDFQRRPEWAIDHDDGYTTFYMYGGALYLHYLYERFFPTRPTFIVDLWEGLASPAPDDEGNEPDWIDSLDALLERQRVGFVDTLLEFVRWRFYVGRLDDGRHLSEAGFFPDSAEVRLAGTVAAGGSLTLRPMMTGTTYVEVTGTDTVVVRLTVETPELVTFVVQALPGVGDDHDLVVLRDDVAVVPLVDGRRVLAFTALPADGDADPDLRDATRFLATLEVVPR